MRAHGSGDMATAFSETIQYELRLSLALGLATSVFRTTQSGE